MRSSYLHPETAGLQLTPLNQRPAKWKMYEWVFIIHSKRRGPTRSVVKQLRRSLLPSAPLGRCKLSSLLSASFPWSSSPGLWQIQLHSTPSPTVGHSLVWTVKLKVSLWYTLHQHDLVWNSATQRWDFRLQHSFSGWCLELNTELRWLAVTPCPPSSSLVYILCVYQHQCC